MAKMRKDCWKHYPKFKPEEFACKCGCEKSAVGMDCKLLDILQAVRDRYKKRITITSGHRCQKYNDSKKGSVKNSYHVKYKAADIYIPGITDTEKGRKMVHEFIKTLEGYKFCYYKIGSANAWMGNAMHIEVK